MATIKLHRRIDSPISTLVDDADLDDLAVYRWYFNGHYAIRWDGGRVVYMHRQLLGLVPGDGLQGDHVNGDKLDNRRGNLRAGTQAENAQNVGGRNQPSKTSRHRGVSFDRHAGKWVASATVAGRFHNLGRFEREEDAAQAAIAFRAAHMPFSSEARKAVA